ncbi:MAG: proton-conducting transporter membrane subunit [Armatimonadota bacterium]|nr:proton-conducting transporter membrane subunit [Armatimonadota bacterium]
MPVKPSEIHSLLPALVVFVPAGAGILIFLVGRWLWTRAAIAQLAAAATLGIAVAIGLAVMNGQVLICFGHQFRVDELSALLLVLVAGVSFIAIVYCPVYMRKLVREAGIPSTTRGRLTAFYGWLLLFVATMLWACMSNNIIMLYVAVEASTIASGLLVAFSWDKRALEAGYKYLMLLTVGITFALFGCVLVYATGSSVLGGSKGMLISELRRIAASFPSTTVALASAFLIVGFGTKAGVAPFHPWLPDAHAEAPTPVSALLSGVMLKVAIYAMVRTVTLFYPNFPPVAAFILALGVFTMILGDLMALAQDDLKRMLAYSSVSQMGYVLMGIGLGTNLGIYAGLFHIINHALAKSLLFLAAGAVMYSTGARMLSEMGGLAKKMPITSFCFFVGALALSGMPPLNGFQSKLALFVAGAQAGAWWAVVLGIGTSLITLVVLVRAAKNIFWGKMPESIPESAREAPARMCLAMLVLAVLCLAIGIYPQSVYSPLSKAAKSVQTIVTDTPNALAKR